MRDQFGREIRDLRISLTDRCNLRCVYCMPEHMVFKPRDELLTDEEIMLIVRVAADLGVKKVRLTGGEPTVRPNLVDLVRRIAAVPEIQDLAMTTNGILLSRLAKPLAQAGLRRINVSLDSLDAEKFRRITRWGNLDDLLAGLEAARDAGLSPIKLNAVVVRGFNEDDVVDVARLTLEHAWDVRFIEMMPFGSVAGFQTNAYVSSAETMARIEEALGPLLPLDVTGYDPARTYRLDGAPGTLGFISAVSQPFCAQCGRLRLTAEGRLRLCLLRDDEVDLRTPLRAGATYEEMRERFRAAAFRRPWGHELAQNVIPLQRVMSQIGG
ncbi:MAG TPA: GTP 3',8-cyclase MoaA [Candidatus Acidoferrales bacterium]|nr:GTP 3',8-cyclase MoaA [Candidatus Acidoferrales bacterium]